MKLMKLTTVERERITDSILKLQSVRGSLDKVEEGKIPHAEEIESCLEDADHNLKVALGYQRSEAPSGTRPPGQRGSEDT